MIAYEVILYYTGDVIYTLGKAKWEMYNTVVTKDDVPESVRNAVNLCLLIGVDQANRARMIDALDILFKKDVIWLHKITFNNATKDHKKYLTLHINYK